MTKRAKRTNGRLRRPAALLGAATLLALVVVMAAAPRPGFSGGLTCHIDAHLPLALGDDAEAAARAIDALRQGGQEVLDALLAIEPADDRDAERLERVVDRVAGQKDARFSGLFWHTDIEEAKARARRSGRSILSLRLLGRLDEELSCANSRFFRTVLYADAGVRARLRERYVLHWESVRPVPVVTIDLGDGRRIRTTVTGNSIHYVLDAEGRPIDALPGLYGPGAFNRALDQVEEALAAMRGAPDAGARRRIVQAHHARRLAAIAEQVQEAVGAPDGGDAAGHAGADADFPPLDEERLASDLWALAVDGGPPRLNGDADGSGDASSFPDARTAGRRAMAKAAFEDPLLVAFTAGAAELLRSARSAPDDAAGLDAAAWEELARRGLADARLNARSRALMRRHHAPNESAAPVDAAGFEAAVERFELAVALDTIRNEWLLRSRIHTWFVEGGSTSADVAALNRRVYDELFLTPHDDPWLGLRPTAYAALPNGGLWEPSEGADD